MTAGEHSKFAHGPLSIPQESRLHHSQTAKSSLLKLEPDDSGRSVGENHRRPKEVLQIFVRPTHAIRP